MLLVGVATVGVPYSMNMVTFEPTCTLRLYSCIYHNTLSSLLNRFAELLVATFVTFLVNGEHLSDIPTQVTWYHHLHRMHSTILW